MDMQRVVDILKTEKECVLRNEEDNCDRECFACDLVMPAGEILQAYTFAIGCIEGLMSVSKDGTLTVTVDDYSKVRRILVQDNKNNGGLFYADSN